MATETITIEAHKAALDTLTVQLGETHTTALDAAKADFTAKLEQAGKDAAAALNVRDEQHTAALAKQSDEYKAALDKLVAEKDAAHTAALAEKDAAIAKLSADHKAELDRIAEEHKAALVQAEIDGAAKLGVRPIVLRQAAATLAKVPAPAATDREKWDQYTALCETDKDAAEAFKAAYLSRK